MPPLGSDTSSPKDTSRQAMSIRGQLSMFDLPIWKVIDRSTSSQESAAGPSPSVSLDMAMEMLCGPAPAPASPSPPPASAKASTTPATCGPSSGASSPSDALQSSLESKLRALLTGSDLCEVIWKPWNTPWGQCLSRPRARVLTTSETASGLWRTMNTREKVGGEYSDPAKALKRLTSGHQINLQDQAMTSLWATPTSRDHKDRGYCPNVPINALLGRQVWTWPSPAAMEPDVDPQVVIDRKKRLSESTGVHRGPALPLGSMVKSNGSSEPTEKPGALNPEFVCWLMGYPTEWVSCGALAMQSIPGRRRRSSKPTAP